MTHVCGHDCSTPGQPLVAMNQDSTSLRNGRVNELARGREVDEEIRVVNVLHRNPQLFYPASRNISWDRVHTDRHDVSNPPLRDGSRGSSSDQTVRKKRVKSTRESK